MFYLERMSLSSIVAPLVVIVGLASAPPILAAVAEGVTDRYLGVLFIFSQYLHATSTYYLSLSSSLYHVIAHFLL